MPYPNYIDHREQKWREKREDVVDYKDYITYLPSPLRRRLSTQIPYAKHSFLPPQYVAKAIEKSLSQGDLDESHFLVKWYEKKCLVMTAAISETADIQTVIVMRHLGNRKETVIFVCSDDVVQITSWLEEVLDRLDDTFRELLGRGNL